MPLKLKSYLSSRDSKSTPIIWAGFGLPSQGHQLLNILHFHQNFITEKLHLLKGIKWAHRATHVSLLPLILLIALLF